jgi:guanine deaminase
MCYTALHWARIHKIYFGTRTSDTAKLGFNELNISDEVLRQLGHDKEKLVPGHHEEECRELLEYWKQKNPKTY